MSTQPPIAYPNPVPIETEPPLPFVDAATNTLAQRVPLTQNPAVYVNVPANSTVTVYDIMVPPTYFAVVQRIGNNFLLAMDQNNNPLFYYNFLIDGELIEKVVRIIADVNSPRDLNPPFVAVREIQWVCVNNTSSPFIAEIVCDGYMELRGDRRS